MPGTISNATHSEIAVTIQVHSSPRTRGHTPWRAPLTSSVPSATLPRVVSASVVLMRPPTA